MLVVNDYLSRMKHFVLALLALAAACSNSDECDLAESELNLRKTKTYGEECTQVGYQGCDRFFDDCTEGSCEGQTGDNGGRICTRSCTGDDQCGGIGVCADGICQRNASCSTFCTDTECCTYARDPSDPTKCVQTGCR